MKKVGVLDYGSGNLHSVTKALQHVGAEVTVTGHLEELSSCEALVVPGVGAFSECMQRLNEVGGVDYIRGWVAKDRPLLGICVGHQVLFDYGLEHGVPTDGVGLFEGVVSELVVDRIPHMGWNRIEAQSSSSLFRGIERERFYFVHSYAVQQAVRGAAYTMHENVRFVGSVEQGTVCSTQFHPEKSGDAGLKLLENWLNSF